MACYNPFIVNGKIRFPANTNLVRHVNGREGSWRQAGLPVPGLFHQDDVARDILWSDFSARSRAGEFSLHDAQPDDRVYLARRTWTTSLLFSALSDRIAGATRPRRGASVSYTRCSTAIAPSTILTTTDSAEGGPANSSRPGQGALPRARRTGDAVPTESPPGGGPRLTKPSRTCSTRRVPPEAACRSHP